jgi:tetratricopeptide (TPR) repeat protein
MTNNCLVRVASEGPDQTVGSIHQSLNPVFQLSGLHELNIDAEVDSSEVQDYFAHLIARYPGDLRSHVQRINLHVARGEPDRTYGALLDLFIALGAKGESLRKRMLQAAYSTLTKETFEVFSVNIERGISSTDVTPTAASSVLTKGVQGTSQLITRVEANHAPSQDALAEAHACLEYGQISEAQSILEQALLAQPEKEELHQDLLEIYQSTGDRQRFHEMLDTLGKDQNPYSELWELMAASF